jgi:hypothetical protein
MGATRAHRWRQRDEKEMWRCGANLHSTMPAHQDPPRGLLRTLVAAAGLAAVTGAAAAVDAADIVPVGATRSVALEASVGHSPFRAACTLRAEEIVLPAASSAGPAAAAASAAGPRWRVALDAPLVLGGGGGGEEEALAAGIRSGSGLLRLRARANALDASSPYVYASARLCALASAGWKPDVVLVLGPGAAGGEAGASAAEADAVGQGLLHSLDIRVSASAAAAASAGSSACAALADALPAAAAASSSSRSVEVVPRFKVAPFAEGETVPVLTGGKGVPYPGQRELTQAEVLAAAGGGDADSQAAAFAAAEKVEKEKEKGAAAQGGWSSYLPYVLGGWVLLNFLNKGTETAAPAAGGRRAPAAAAARG